MCHELNLFIYFKDPRYFTSVVRPFIRNKMEKEFVDFWLLEDMEKLEDYTNVDLFHSLNCLEKCLLVSTYVKHDRELATILANRIGTGATKDELYNELFDDVLNFDMLDNEQALKFEQTDSASQASRAEEEKGN
jgi:hypothetical protein